MKAELPPKQRSNFNLLFSIVSFDNIASAIVLPLLIHLLFPCEAGAVCRNIGVTDNVVFWSGLVFLLSPSYLFVSPIIGRLADFYGHKFALRICLILSIAGYLLLLIANNWSHVILALIAVLLLNAGSSSMTAAQSAAIHISTGQRRAYLFSLITFIMLPLYLTVTALSKLLLNLIHTYPYITNLIVTLAFFISVGNLLMLRYVQDNSISALKRIMIARLDLPSSAVIFSRQIIILLLLFALFEFATSWYFESMFNITETKFYFDINGFSVFLYFKIAIMILGTCVVYPILIKRYSPHQLLIASLVLCCAGITGCVLLPVAKLQWLFITAYTLGEIAFIPTAWYLLAEMAPSGSQGLIMGVKGSLWSLSWSLGLITGNKLHDVIGSNTSTVIIGLLIITSLLLVKQVRSAK